MLGRLDKFVGVRPPKQVLGASIVLVAVIGLLDYLTGYELSFSIFYLAPIALGAWYAGRRAGFALCAVSGVTWLVVDYASGHAYSHPTIPLWNAAVRLGFFTVTAYLFVTLREHLALEAELARQDGLTGVMNARAFKERSRAVFELARRHGRPVSLGYIDLDNFKGVNDRFGHSEGDRVLQAVAAALVERVRSSDLVGRLGGDEFAVLLPETDSAGARAACATLHEGLVRLAQVQGWPIGFSIGVAVFRVPAPNPDEAIRYADDLMYRVKGNAKNHVVLEEYDGMRGPARAGPVR